MLNRKSHGWVIKMNSISNERLEMIAKNALSDERRMMATEILALRKERERAEPVAWRSEGPFAVTRFKSVAGTWMAKGWKVTPLYTAPPAPVVPVHVFNDAYEQYLNGVLCGDNNKQAALSFLNACRAAVLK